MSYEKQNWIDHIEDDETGEVFQEGTLFTAKRMNHIEEGIYQTSSQINDIKEIIINVKDFGAKGDGITDDTQAIQNALDSINTKYQDATDYNKSSIGYVVFPQGDYLITDTLIMTRGAGIKGIKSGVVKSSTNTTYGTKATRLIFQTTEEKPCIKCCGYDSNGNYTNDLKPSQSDIDTVYSYRSDNINIKNIELYSVNKNAIGIHMINSIFSSVKNVTIKNFKYGLLVSSCWGSIFEKIHLENKICNLYVQGYSSSCNFTNLTLLTCRSNFETGFIDTISKGSYPNIATSIILDNTKGVSFNSVILEEAKRAILIYNSKNISFTTLNIESIETSIFDIVNSDCNLYNFKEWTPTTKNPKRFTLTSSSTLTSNFTVVTTNDPDLLFECDSTSFINIQNSDMWIKSIPNDNVSYSRNKELIGYDAKKDLLITESDPFATYKNHTYSKKTYYTQCNGRSVSVYGEYEITNYEQNEKDYAICRFETPIYSTGYLKGFLKNPFNSSDEKIKKIIIDCSDPLYSLICDENLTHLPISTLKKYSTIIFFGNLVRK